MATGGQDHVAELAQAQRLEAIGRFAGGIVHDFNNLLSVMLSYTTLILEELNAKDPLRADIEEIKLAAERASELTRGLLNFSRRRASDSRPIDVNEVLGTLERIIRRIIGTDVSLTVALASAPSFIRADPSALEQVIMNLVVNARDAMPSGGQLTIETQDAIVDGKPCVVITITDTGVGMSADVLGHVFEPFFTTKEPGKGTGLGLATVNAIVTGLGGQISAASEPTKGCTFQLLFPRVDPPSGRESLPPTSSQPLSALLYRGTETVLVVDGDAPVRSCLKNTLRRFGYQVIEAPNAGEALLICEQHEAPIHLLLTDLELPRVNGRQLAQRVAALKPEMRVLYMTTNAIEGMTDVLAKPVTAASLTRRVRETLDAKSM